MQLILSTVSSSSNHAHADAAVCAQWRIQKFQKGDAEQGKLSEATDIMLRSQLTTSENLRHIQQDKNRTNSAQEIKLMWSSQSELVNASSVFTARCTLVQSAVLRSHVVCPSVCDVGELWSHRLEFFRNNFTMIAWDVRSLQHQHDGSAPRGTPPKFGPKVTHPLLIWASETLDRKLRPNGHI